MTGAEASRGSATVVPSGRMAARLRKGTGGEIHDVRPVVRPGRGRTGVRRGAAAGDPGTGPSSGRPGARHRLRHGPEPARAEPCRGRPGTRRRRRPEPGHAAGGPGQGVPGGSGAGPLRRGGRDLPGRAAVRRRRGHAGRCGGLRRGHLHVLTLADGGCRGGLEIRPGPAARRGWGGGRGHAATLGARSRAGPGRAPGVLAGWRRHHGPALADGRARPRGDVPVGPEGRPRAGPGRPLPVRPRPVRRPAPSGCPARCGRGG